jgi:hypothetical protein
MKTATDLKLYKKIRAYNIRALQRTYRSITKHHITNLTPFVLEPWHAKNDKGFLLRVFRNFSGSFSPWSGSATFTFSIFDNHRRTFGHVFAYRTITSVRFTAPSDAPYLRHDHLHTFRHRFFFLAAPFLHLRPVRPRSPSVPSSRSTLHVSSPLHSTLFSFALGPDRPHLPSVPSSRLHPHCPTPLLSTLVSFALGPDRPLSPSVPSRQSMRSTQGGPDGIYIYYEIILFRHKRQICSCIMFHHYVIY